MRCHVRSNCHRSCSGTQRINRRARVVCPALRNSSMGSGASVRRSLSAPAPHPAAHAHPRAQKGPVPLFVTPQNGSPPQRLPPPDSPKAQQPAPTPRSRGAGPHLTRAAPFAVGAPAPGLEPYPASPTSSVRQQHAHTMARRAAAAWHSARQRDARSLAASPRGAPPIVGGAPRADSTAAHERCGAARTQAPACLVRAHTPPN